MIPFSRFKYFIVRSIPSRISCPSSTIILLSPVMNGSHSAPLITRVVHSSRFFGSILMLVGNEAPPNPTIPLALTALTKSA